MNVSGGAVASVFREVFLYMESYPRKHESLHLFLLLQLQEQDILRVGLHKLIQQ